MKAIFSDAGKQHWVIWVFSTFAGLAVLVIILSHLIGSETLRGQMERRINSRLKGYTVHVGKAYFHPLSLAVNLRDLVLIQQENPDPPVADIGRLQASLRWREILTGHIVGDISIYKPVFHVNLTQFRTEEKSTVPINKKGW
ncbi:MAG TPA: hypothetical protein VHO84_06160, partial [Syntrophorhabdaceae bacterium]|nr:hypothetical protein [Syntrophorhabdaceae bacterium]